MQLIHNVLNFKNRYSLSIWHLAQKWVFKCLIFFLTLPRLWNYNISLYPLLSPWNMLGCILSTRFYEVQNKKKVINLYNSWISTYKPTWDTRNIPVGCASCIYATQTICSSLNSNDFFFLFIHEVFVRH